MRAVCCEDDFELDLAVPTRWLLAQRGEVEEDEGAGDAGGGGCGVGCAVDDGGEASEHA